MREVRRIDSCLDPVAANRDCISRANSSGSIDVPFQEYDVAHRATEGLVCNVSPSSSLVVAIGQSGPLVDDKKRRPLEGAAVKGIRGFRINLNVLRAEHEDVL